MTDQLKNQIITVATYDDPKQLTFICSYDELPYNKADEWLMPVARKVWQELTDMFMERSTMARLDMINDLEESAFKSTADLFQSVYNCITYIHELKRTK